MSRVLLVSGSDRSREDLTREITESGWPCVGAADAAQARALLQGEEFALIIADTPLPETGALLREVLDGTASMVLLLARAGFAPGRTSTRLEARGALVLQKPLNKALFLRTVRLAMVARRRLLEIKTENAGLHHKIEEIRLIDRAKCVLIQYLGLTEPQAHQVHREAGHGPAGLPQGGCGGYSGGLRDVNGAKGHAPRGAGWFARGCERKSDRYGTKGNPCSGKWHGVRGQLLRSRKRGRWGIGFHDGHDRLFGDVDRSQHVRANRRTDVPADRQCRRDPFRF